MPVPAPGKSSYNPWKCKRCAAGFVPHRTAELRKTDTDRLRAEPRLCTRMKVSAVSDFRETR